MKLLLLLLLKINLVSSVNPIPVDKQTNILISKKVG